MCLKDIKACNSVYKCDEIKLEVLNDNVVLEYTRHNANEFLKHENLNVKT